MHETYLGTKQWTEASLPNRVLVIRFYALGDLVITLPYLHGLKMKYPEMQIDILTVDENVEICQSIHLFETVIATSYGRNTAKLVLHSVLQIPKLLNSGYDIVIDLQNNWVSRMIRKIIQAKAWSTFDRFSSISAGERTFNTINALKIGIVSPDYNFNFKDKELGQRLLKQHGWKENKLVVVNPAGYFDTRNWPLDNYVKFAELWLKEFDNTQFLILGIERIKLKAEQLEQKLNGSLINLVGHTSAAEAFSIIQYVDFVLSEDSGLMHMAWVSGKPTLALFGSSRNDWSKPLGSYSKCLNSADLECGECMAPECKYGDVHCLTRFTPEMVFDEAIKLFKQTVV